MCENLSVTIDVETHIDTKINVSLLPSHFLIAVYYFWIISPFLVAECPHLNINSAVGPMSGQVPESYHLLSITHSI